MRFRGLQLWIIRLPTFWKTVPQGCVVNNFRMPRRILIICFLTLTVAYFAVWRSNNWYTVYKFLPEEKGWLPKIEQETLYCTDLLKAAEQILEGTAIPLPYGGKQTLWKFQPRVSRRKIVKNLVYGRSLNDSFSDVRERRKGFDVSSSDVKVRKLFITFGHNCCAYAKQRALKAAKAVGGFDYVRSFDLNSLPRKFRETHHDVLRSRRGAGYWLWKPYILLKTLMESMNEGDIVMYQDAGAYLLRSAGPLLKLGQQSKEGIIVFTLSTMEMEYTKQDAFILMEMNITEATRTFQRLASFVVLRKSCSALQFVLEWLAYLSDRRIASDDPNTLGEPNANVFRDHRHDQSVLSLLSKKWGLPAFRDPSQFGELLPTSEYYSSGPYDQIFMHDRFKQ